MSWGECAIYTAVGLFMVISAGSVDASSRISKSSGGLQLSTQCNVLISDEGQAALSDYDLNSIWDAATFTTISVVSATRWQAPEVFLNETDPLSFTEPSDVFSFAMLLFEVSGTSFEQPPSIENI